MTTVVLVIDSFGIGALPDADKYGDCGANTAGHICGTIHGEKWPFLRKMGLGNASELLGNPLEGVKRESEPLSWFGVMEEASPGKDTTTGHWEMAGIILDEPFEQFPQDYPSFPEDLVQAFIKETGCGGILGNKAASGTEIIKELGEEHLKTGYPICYTSADSVFQIACHKDKYSIEELYGMCEIARKLCDPLKVGRVIARPFDGEPGSFSRTPERHDYSIALPEDTLLDVLQKKGVETVAIGKIGSIFLEQGIDRSYHDAGNPACLAKTCEVLQDKTDKDRFVFVNLVDTDMVYGHRRDVEGYYNAVDNIDSKLPKILNHLNEGDRLVITGDHGCDPAFKGSDHTREYVPVLFQIKGEPGGSLGIRPTFADLAATIAESYGTAMKRGTSFFPSV
ncbi:MAG: phosphopentomutase [Spirochaetales bacterium]|nr:phosphopentomutase [Spirochaetales bacterium]